MHALCDLPVPELYLENPESVNEPSNFAKCSTLGSTCEGIDCSCRYAISSIPGSSTADSGVCAVVDKRVGCVSTDTKFQLVECDNTSAISGSSTRSYSDESSRASAPSSNSSSNEKQPSTTADSSSAATGSSAGTNAGSSGITASSSSVNTPVLVVIIIGCVVFVALALWLLCKKRILKNNDGGQISTRRLSLVAMSPTKSPSDSATCPQPSPSSVLSFATTMVGRSRRPLTRTLQERDLQFSRDVPTQPMHRLDSSFDGSDGSFVSNVTSQAESN